jgi:AraC-like DNA-binding protein
MPIFMLMLLRFPPIPANGDDPNAIYADGKLFARLKTEFSPVSRPVFLTEHVAVMVTKGMKRLHFPDQTVEVQPGNIILLRKGIYMMAEYVEEGMDFEAIMLVLDSRILRELGMKTPQGPAQYGKAPQGPSQYGKAPQGMVQDGKATRGPVQDGKVPQGPAQDGQGAPGRTRAEDRPYWLLETSDLIDDLKSQLKGYFGKPLLDPQGLLSLKQRELLLLLQTAGHSPQVKAFLRSALSEAPEDLDYIVRINIFQPISIEDLALLTNRSLATFKRDFQRMYGESPRRWINQQRLNHARTLLQSTGMTVSEVAFECGFDSTSYFIRIYKESFGTTPQASRANTIID